MEGVEEGFGEIEGGGHIVYGDQLDSVEDEREMLTSYARCSIQLLASFSGLPCAEEFDEEIVREAGVQHLRKQKNV